MAAKSKGALLVLHGLEDWEREEELHLVDKLRAALGARFAVTHSRAIYAFPLCRQPAPLQRLLTNACLERARFVRVRRAGARPRPRKRWSPPDLAG